MFCLFLSSLLVGISATTKYEFLLANGPTYVNSNNSYYFPYGDPKYDLKLKLLHVDSYTGLWINLLRGQPGSILGTHRHYDQVYGYTLKGAWGYREHPEWLSKEGDLVHETPGSIHTLVIDDNHGETEVLFFVWGALAYLDEYGNTIHIEDWKSVLKKYTDHCEKNNLPIIDITYPKTKVPDKYFQINQKNEL